MGLDGKNSEHILVLAAVPVCLNSGTPHRTPMNLYKIASMKLLLTKCEEKNLYLDSKTIQTNQLILDNCGKAIEETVHWAGVVKK